MPGPDRSRRRIPPSLAVALLSAGLGAAGGVGPGAASDIGTIVGRVFDSTTHAPLPLASVVLSTVPVSWWTGADAEGNFLLHDVSGGSWKVVFSAPGYQTVIGSVPVGAGETTGVSASLRPGADTVVVTTRQFGPHAPLIVTFPREPELRGDGLLDSWYSAEFLRAVGFTADGRRLGLGTQSGLAVYRPRGGQLLLDHAWRFPPPGPTDLAVAAGPGGMLRVRTAADSLALVEEPDPDLADCPVERLADAGYSPHLRLAFSDDRERLVAWGPAVRRPLVWRVADGQTLAHLPTQLEVQCAAFTPDGAALALGGKGSGQVAELWDLAARRLRGRLSADSTGAGARTLVVDPRGRFLITGNTDHTLSCWNLADLALRWRLAPNGCCAGEFLALSPDGELVVTGSGSGLVFVDTGSGTVVRKLKTNHERGIRSAAFAPDGSSLATIGYDSRLALWSVDRLVPRPQ
jgi:WD40 repeat protein